MTHDRTDVDRGTAPTAHRAAGPARRPAHLDVVIPAYNEAHRIAATLDALTDCLVAAGVDARIIVVDNASSDRTVDEVARSRHHHPLRVDLVNCAVQGKGAAVRAGVRHATAPYVAYLDADRSTPPEAVLTGLALLEHGWDAVIGSRRAFGGAYAVPQSPLRRVGSRVFHVAASSVVRGISDTQCGLKLFRTAAVRPLLEASHIDGFAFDVELLARVRAAGLRAMELPVTWSDSAGSTFSPVKDGLTSFAELARVRRVLRRAHTRAVHA